MIPVNEPLLDGREKQLLIECIETGWISSDGPFVAEFEKKFGQYLGLPPGVAVCNGTAALEAALYGLGIGEGDEVILPSFTIISCAIAILRLGAVPVLVDIEPKTWCMDVDQVEDRITGRTKAIMAVHIYGHPVHMDPLLLLAERYGIRILEDAAEVHGAEYRSAQRGNSWIKCGAIGDAAAYSFYANKILTTGEGGMVVSPHPDVIERARSYRNLCFRPDRRFYHTELGYNFRMTNLQAAIGVAQVERIEEFVALKRKMGAYYGERLAGLDGIRFQIERPWAKTVYWMYSIQIDADVGIDAETLMSRLRDKGVGTRPFFLGLHRQPALLDRGLFNGEQYPVTDEAYKYGLYLPSGLTINESTVDRVCDALKQSLDQS